MSPRTEEQYKQIRTDRRTSILDAALHVFAEEGFHSASISKVSKAAGVSKGLMYNYFKSKEDLLHQLLDKIILKETDIMRFVNEKEFTSDSVASFLHYTVELLKEDPKHWKLYFLMSVQPEVMKILMEDHVQIHAEFNSKFMKFFEKQGHKDPVLQLQYFGAAFGGLKMSYVFDPDNFPIDKVCELIIKQFISK
jgi:AcrR family transcriptional regulator